MVLGQFSPLGGTLESLRQNRALLADQIRSRIAAAHADKPIEQQLEVRGGPVPIDRPYKRPRRRLAPGGRRGQGPKEGRAGDRYAARSNCRAERDGRGSAGIARLDLWLAVLVAQIL
jgi:hypothetical protein